MQLDKKEPVKQPNPIGIKQIEKPKKQKKPSKPSELKEPTKYKEFKRNSQEVTSLIIGQEKLEEDFTSQIKNLEEKRNFIRKNGLNIEDFPEVLDHLQEKSINHFIRAYSEDFCQLKFKDYPKKLRFLVYHLVREGNIKKAAMLIKKYELEKYVNQDICKKALEENGIELVQQNILEKFDNFGPTEKVVYGSDKEFIQLSDFGVEEKNVYVIDKINKDFELASKILTSSPIIGLDTEFTSEINKLDLISFATVSQIFLIDYQPLKNSQQLTTLMFQLFCKTPKTRFVGIALSNDMKLISKAFNLYPDPAKLINLKTEMPFLGGGLKSMCLNAFEKLLSKYQQCSNWGLRPLRRTQIHYAALDARVLVELWEMRDVLNEIMRQRRERKQQQKRRIKRNQERMRREQKQTEEGDIQANQNQGNEKIKGQKKQNLKHPKS